MINKNQLNNQNYNKLHKLFIKILVSILSLFLLACANQEKQFLIDDDLLAWRNNSREWKVVGEAFVDPENENLIATKPGSGIMVNGETGKIDDIYSKKEYGDIELHVEFMIPKASNSGIYFMGRYELQIKDSWGKEKLDFHDGGTIYPRWDSNIKERGYDGYEGHLPLVDANLAPGEWQYYDVIFRALRFDNDGNKISNAKMERVVQNGKIIHENVELTGPTRGSTYNDESSIGPIRIQGDHGHVAYRNMWLKELN